MQALARDYQPAVAHHHAYVGRVLLVEDNEFNRDMLSRRLRRSGWEVEVAIDGVQGLERARGGEFDLILMDMSLPEMDGWSVTRLLKENLHTRDIPIIALTAHAMNGDREKAMLAGCDEFETKPVEYSRLLGKMTEFVAGKDL
ncbi:CheY-like chemotaxis protein [Granulicella aggregans]|uniref:CheY-like chemotaxis protein n=1 Tax=Granulicella aggregans TaxID=474949 RepID=A0A7W7ZDT4_9BACT|nr:response regulator [Granulicella aggregans]MBB5058013.1 CheY-like chemotaxis protein [Granulicella aggregans]